MPAVRIPGSTLFWAVLVGLLATGIRLAFLFTRGDSDLPIRIDHWATIGEALAQGHGFALPTPGTDGYHPTAYRLPVVPLWLSLFYRLFTDPERVILVSQCVLDGITAAMLVGLGRAVSRTLPGGITAGLLWTAYTPEWWLVLQIWSEPMFVLWLTLSLAATWGAIRHPTAARFAVAGLAWGACGLTRPLGVLIGVPVLLAATWLTRSHRDVMGRGLTALIMVAALLSPWVARNALTFDRLVVFDTTGGFNAYVGTLGLDPYVGPEDFVDPALRRQVLGADSFTADKLLREAALERVAADPVGHLSRSLRRFFMFFFWPSNLDTLEVPWHRAVAHLGLYGLAVLGFRRLRGPSRRFGLILWITLGVMALVQCQIVMHPRLIAPAIPCWALLAGGLWWRPDPEDEENA